MRMQRMPRHLFLTVLLLSLAGGAALPARAETRAGGTLDADAVWTKEGSPYIVTGDVIVPKDLTLRIDPGVTVRFKRDIVSREGENPFDLEILVRGTLVVTGAAKDTVYLTSDELEPRWTDWQGVVLDGPDARADLKNVIIEFANEGVRCKQGTVNADNLTVRRCAHHGVDLMQGTARLDNSLFTTIGNTGGTGVGVNADRGSTVTMNGSFIIGTQNGIIFSRGSGGTISNSVVSNCVSIGVVIRKSNPEFTNCTIVRNDYGFVISADAAPEIHKNNIFDNATLDVRLKDYDTETRLDLTSNWWGEDQISLIDERIEDGIDNTAVKAFAVIDPILTEATTDQGRKQEQ